MRTAPPDPNWPRLLGLAVHELRTPISVGSGYLRMLLTSTDAELTARQKLFVTESQKAWGRMTTLAEEMSELSHLEAGTFKIDLKRIDIRRVLAETVEGLPPAEDGSVTVTVTGTADEMFVQGDANRLRIALTSLLLALRREIVTSTDLLVEVSTRDVDGQAVCWIAVADPEHLGPLSSAASGALATFDEWRGGSGLKLAIARRIINAHGGAVWSPADGAKAGAAIALPIPDAGTRAPGRGTRTAAAATGAPEPRETT